MKDDIIWPKRFFILDVSRGIAALSVILWHWQHFTFQIESQTQFFDRSSQPFYIILKLFYEAGLKGVDYFFLLSGFIFFWIYQSAIENRKINFTTFWVLRFSRLYPLHFVTLLIVAGLQRIYFQQVATYFTYSANDLYHFLLNLGFASKWGFEQSYSFNGPVWSVSVEILLYLAFFIVVFYSLGRTSLILGISIITFTLNLALPNTIFYGLSLFFAGGFFFHLTVALSTKFHKWQPVIYGVALFAWLLVLINFYIFDLGQAISEWGIIWQIMLIAFPVYILYPFTVSSLVLLELNKGNFLQPISWIGDITYSSYLLHFPLQLLFILAINEGLFNPYLYLKPGYLLAFFFILIPVSYITYIKFERPVQNMIRQRYYNFLMKTK